MSNELNSGFEETNNMTGENSPEERRAELAKETVEGPDMLESGIDELQLNSLPTDKSESDTSEETADENSGDASEETADENSGDTSEETADENSSDASEETINESSKDTSADGSDNLSNETEKNDQKDAQGGEKTNSSASSKKKKKSTRMVRKDEASSNKAKPKESKKAKNGKKDEASSNKAKQEEIKDKGLKKASLTKAFEEGTIDIESVRRRHQYRAFKKKTYGYYDSEKELQIVKHEKWASRSFTELAAGVKANLQEKQKYVLKVTIKAADISDVYGAHAIASYISPDAPNDDPCYILVPYSRFAEFSLQELRERKFSSRFEFIKRRVGAVTSIVPVMGPIEHEGSTYFIGDRLLAREMEKNKWFIRLENKEGEFIGYKYKVGDMAQVRVQAVASGSMWVELMGVEANIPAQEIKLNFNSPSQIYKPGDIVWAKITELLRDEETWRVYIRLSILKTKEKNGNDILFDIVKKGQVWDGVVTHVNNPKSYMFVDIGNDSRVFCKLIPGIRTGDKVKVHMHAPWYNDENQKMLSGYADRW